MVNHGGMKTSADSALLAASRIASPSESSQKTQHLLLNALKDEELKKLICNIDCSPDAEIELNKAMELDVFCIFTDKILSTINPQQGAVLSR